MKLSLSSREIAPLSLMYNPGPELNHWPIVMLVAEYLPNSSPLEVVPLITSKLLSGYSAHPK